ncbi:MAG TPA: hypothetical protein VGF33_09955 [Caulobacteraceae bacterium]|jgi:hypothetical protein
MVDLTAQTEMVNDALIYCGKEPVADLSQTSLGKSIAAQKIMRVIEKARRTVLEANGWAVALEYATILPSVLPNAPFVPRYPTTFLMPGDFVRAWEVEGVPCEWDFTTSTYPQFAWEPRWQIGTTEVNGSSQWFMRAARGAGAGLFADGVGYALGDWGGTYPPESNTVAQLNPLVYVRLADWGSMTPTMRDLISRDAARRAGWAITGNMQLAQALKSDYGEALAKAVGPDAMSEGGQPSIMPSLPQRLRDYSR